MDLVELIGKKWKLNIILLHDDMCRINCVAVEFFFSEGIIMCSRVFQILFSLHYKVSDDFILK